MPSDDIRIARRMLDIIENIDAAKRFVAGYTFDGFAGDDRTHYAVVRALEIVSEASRHVPDEMKSRHPDIEWRKIKAAGNVYRHGYEDVDAQAIWDTVQQYLDPLRAAISAELEALRK
ncbi:MAG TPA: HepT-like ribonuclease domain-containing protein [Rhizomicrobium sp.]|jgi:uncharacterized protein with HEPN domain|nr:HepT-like ribonuclease domain-containing protein [Rhizomicrobium sp.]